MTILAEDAFLEHTHRWGVALEGLDDEKACWLKVLKPPFDPFLTIVSDPRGNYVALISRQFDSLATAREVRAAAKQMLPVLTASMHQKHRMGPLRVGDSIEFLDSQETPRRHFFIEAKTGQMVLKGGFVEIVHKDAQGNIIESDPMPSAAQRWMEAAQKEPRIASAIGYLPREATWYDFYKAYEALWPFSRVGISRNELNRFKQTANALDNRHSTHSPVGKKGARKTNVRAGSEGLAGAMAE